jgi:MFS superfamily sulfate permease-like transporter
VRTFIICYLIFVIACIAIFLTYVPIAVSGTLTTLMGIGLLVMAIYNYKLVRRRP